LRRAQSDGRLPTPKNVRRVISSKQAAAYYQQTASPADVAPIVQAELVQAESDDVVVMATAVVDGPAAPPLKVDQAVAVTKAGIWISELARIKSINPDGTYNVQVFHKFSSDGGRLKEELVLTNKPYPNEVKAAHPSTAARLEALAKVPPEMFEPYKVRVVRDRDGREEWGVIHINTSLRWVETIQRVHRSAFEEVCLTSPSRMWKTVPGAEEKNQLNLLDEIVRVTKWDDMANADVYCGGSKLSSFHTLRVHSIMCAGRPLVIVRKGQPYDKDRWAPIAEVPSTGGGCCVVL